MSVHLLCVVGARPNFVKMAPILRALDADGRARVTLLHTGQHYDAKLSDVFFEELGMRRPDISLGVGSGKHGEQTARILERFEEVLERGPEENGSGGSGQYDRVVVVGDVNSTMAATLASAKLQVPVAHVEAGLRSFDRSMPEEINRIVTDALADMLLVSEPHGLANLRAEGHPDERLHLVGNVMIDTLFHLLPAARERSTLADHGLEPDGYGVVTLHRPANVDSEPVLRSLLDVLIETSKSLPLVFPVHPRTDARLEAFGLTERLAGSGVRRLPPLGYLDFLSLTSRAKVIVTDSGGLQEESTALGIPCLTMRENTERPITVDEGTSTLVGHDAEALAGCLGRVLAGTYECGRRPELWDGRAAERIAKLLVERTTSERMEQ